jgi:hypothetical protein
VAIALTLTVDTPRPPFESKVSEVRYIEEALREASREIGCAAGNVTSGTCGGKGEWIYTPTSTRP